MEELTEVSIDVTLQMMSRAELEAYAKNLKQDNNVLTQALQIAIEAIKCFRVLRGTV